MRRCRKAWGRLRTAAKRTSSPPTMPSSWRACGCGRPRRRGRRGRRRRASNQKRRAYVRPHSFFPRTVRSKRRRSTPSKSARANSTWQSEQDATRLNVSAKITEATDEVAALTARYTVPGAEALEPRIERAAEAALTDSIAVAIGALAHPAAQAGRRHAYRFPAGEDGCLIWGSTKRTTPDLAALTNGVLLRCYDYNDFFVGQRNSGHASDMVSGVIAAAEWSNASGAKLLSGLAIGYEVVGAVYDAFSTAPGGWDYTNLTGIGTTCAIARVLDLDVRQTEEALAMTVVPHFASDEIESGDLN